MSPIWLLRLRHFLNFVAVLYSVTHYLFIKKNTFQENMTIEDLVSDLSWLMSNPSLLKYMATLARAIGLGKFRCNPRVEHSVLLDVSVKTLWCRLFAQVDDVIFERRKCRYRYGPKLIWFVFYFIASVALCVSYGRHADFFYLGKRAITIIIYC